MLSIIVPTLNEEKHIPNLLNCLKNQTYKNFEIIVVDAHSNDKTKEVVKKFKNLKIKIINSEKRNVAYQRNIGVKYANNERILFLDADTKIPKDFLENALKEIKNNEISACRTYPDSSHPIDIFFIFLFRIYLKALYKLIGFNGCCLFSLKSVHNKINGFDETIKVSEDFDYTKRIKKFAKLHLLKKPYIKISMRRFEKNGRIRTGLKILVIGIYIDFGGRIRNNLFNYKFNEK
ncbi:glycosyltransferase [Candidatus Woesearchaeota archaeon]|nr:glycosyltransferase [Candidatus Woesearchaeota archaeon]